MKGFALILTAALIIGTVFCGCSNSPSGDSSKQPSNTESSVQSEEESKTSPEQSSSAASSEQSKEESKTSPEQSSSAEPSEQSEGQNGFKLKDVFEDIGEQVSLPEMLILNDISSLDRYYGISADDVEDYAGGINNTGIEQDEIVMIKAKNDAAAENIQTSLQKRYDSKLTTMKNYDLDEAEKIEKCKVERSGLYVTMIISNDAPKITEIFKSYLTDN